MRGDDVAERLLQAIGLAVGVQQRVEQQAAHRREAAHAAPLRAGDERGVDLAEQLLRRDACGGERLGGAGEVEERHRVGGGEQVGRDPEAREVEPRGQLARDAAAVGHRARHADLRAGPQRDLPRRAGRVAAHRRARGFERACVASSSTSKRSSDGSSTGAKAGEPAASTSPPSSSGRMPVRAATACGVALCELAFGDLGARGGVDPATAVARALVRDEAAQPGEVGDAAGGRHAVDFEVEARGGRPAGAELGGADDHDEVGGLDVRRGRGRDRGVRLPARRLGAAECRKWGGWRPISSFRRRRIHRHVRVAPRQRHHDRRLRVGGGRPPRRVRPAAVSRRRARAAPARAARPPRADRRSPTGRRSGRARPARVPRARAARPDRRARSAASRPPRPENVRTPRRSSTSAATASAVAMSPVPRTHPMRGARIRTREPHDACSLRQRATSTSRPAFVSPYAPSPPKPPWLGDSASRIAGGGAPSGTRAAIAATSRCTPSSWSRSACSDPAPASPSSPAVGIAANGATIVGCSGSRRRSARARSPVCRRGEPRGERVDVGERREVRRQDVQLGARPGRRAVQLAVPAPPRRRVRRGRDDDGRAPGQQPADELGGDRPGARAGDERGLAAQVGLARERVAQARRRARARRRPRAPRGCRAGAPAAGSVPATIRPSPRDAGDRAYAGGWLRRERGRLGRRAERAASDRVAAELGVAAARDLCERSGQRVVAVRGGAPGEVAGGAGEDRVAGVRGDAAQLVVVERAAQARRGRRRRGPSARSPTTTRSARGGDGRSAGRPPARARARARRPARRAARRRRRSDRVGGVVAACRRAAAAPSALAPRGSAPARGRRAARGRRSASACSTRAGTASGEAACGCEVAGAAGVSGRPSASPASSAARSTSAAPSSGEPAGLAARRPSGPPRADGPSRVSSASSASAWSVSPGPSVPCRCEPGGGVGARQARAPERAREARRDGVAQVRAREAVVRRLLADRRDDLAERLARRRLAARQPELAAEVDEHLVAPRRRALEEVVERLVVVELVGRAPAPARRARAAARRRRRSRGRRRPPPAALRRVDGVDGAGPAAGTPRRRARRALGVSAAALAPRRRGSRRAARRAPAAGRRPSPPAAGSSTASRSSSACSSAGAGPARSSDSSVVRMRPVSTAAPAGPSSTIRRAREPPAAAGATSARCVSTQRTGAATWRASSSTTSRRASSSGSLARLAARGTHELGLQRERPPDEVRHPAADEPPVVDGADEALELRAQAVDRGRQHRRVKRDVDRVEHAHGAARQPAGELVERSSAARPRRPGARARSR